MAINREILVCQYLNCQRNGSAEVLAAFQTELLPVTIAITGSDCQGQCNLGPTVRVLPDDTWYCRVQPTDVPEICEQHLLQGKLVDRLLHPRFHPKFY